MIINSFLFAQASTLWNNLISYWTGDNTPNDAKGTNNATLINGATYATGKINNGFSFDGVNDYVNVGNAFDSDGSTPFSMSAWVKADVLSGFKYIVGTQGDGSYKGMGICFDSASIRTYLINTLGSNGISTNTINTYSTATWYNIVVTYDGSKTASGVKVYVNNAFQTSTIIENNLTGSISFPNKSLIGARNVVNNFFDGIIDELGWWNKVLTSTEITELYNSGSGKQYIP